MPDYNTMADALERMAVQQQSLTEASAAFRKLGSIETAIREANARKTAADTEAAQANEELVTIKRKIADATKLHETKMKQAVESLNKLHIDDQDKAEAMLADARIKSANILQDASDKTQAWADGVRQQLTPTLDKLKKAEADCAVLAAKQQVIVAETTDAQAKLDAVREAIGKLAGAA
jgi:hypothetical protein